MVSRMKLRLPISGPGGVRNTYCLSFVWWDQLRRAGGSVQACLFEKERLLSKTILALERIRDSVKDVHFHLDLAMVLNARQAVDHVD